MYGRAPVPPPHALRQPTNELPELEPPPAAPSSAPPFRRGRVDARELGRRAMSGRDERERREPRVPMPNVSWRQSSSAAVRTTMDGWGFTFAGLLILVVGWGVWAAAGGGGSSIPPVLSLVIVIAVGALLFIAFRTVSRVVIERVRKQRRPHARWAHFGTGLFLATVGVSYLLHNAWLLNGLDWVKDHWPHL
jgi:hypothetical protein